MYKEGEFELITKEETVRMNDNMACLVVVPSVNKRYFTKKNEIAQDRKNKNSEDKKQA